jgi:hypothetical protein
MDEVKKETTPETATPEQPRPRAPRHVVKAAQAMGAFIDRPEVDIVEMIEFRGSLNRAGRRRFAHNIRKFRPKVARKDQ